MKLMETTVATSIAKRISSARMKADKARSAAEARGAARPELFERYRVLTAELAALREEAVNTGQAYHSGSILRYL